LDEEELDFLARHRDNLSVVYCPRSHAYFGHAEHPFRRLLAEGASVALGTDSRASNPDLSVLAELRYLYREHSDLPGDVLLQLGTLAGARALGRGEDTGSFVAGKRADLAVVALPDHEAADPYRLLFDSEQPVVGTMCGGRWVFDARR
jgi:cytosine/adenosine deaminase-related metal-dependent hydrolase